MKNRTQQSYDERILRVLVYIQNHLDKKLPLDELASVAEFSPYHFHRIFHSVVGESVKEHVRRLRLERAARSLKMTDEAVTNIAFQAGYETHESFSRAFKTMFGRSPSSYREYCRENESSTDVRSTVHLEKLKNINSANHSGLNVSIQKMEPLRVGFMRRIGAYETTIESQPEILSYMRATIDIGDEQSVIGIPLDDPSITAEENLRYDVCIPVDDQFSPIGEIGVQLIDGGDYAVIQHPGAMHDVEETVLALFGDWFPVSNREARSAPMFIQYTSGDDGTITVHVPLKPTSQF